MIAGANRLLHGFGLELARHRRSPYARLERAPRHRPVTVDLLGRPFRVPDGLSFYWSHREIFIDEIYRFATGRDAPRIVDCGANCGTSVTWFKHLYPGARITAVEADPDVFRLLERNVAAQGLADVELLHRAVSTRSGPVPFYGDGADGGRSVHGATGGETARVETVSLDELIDGPVDFLKMDIEGEETAVLAAATGLDAVAQLFVEYHSFAGAPQSLDRLLRTLTDNGFRYWIRTQFCSQRPLTEPARQQGMDLQLNVFARRDQG